MTTNNRNIDDNASNCYRSHDDDYVTEMTQLIDADSRLAKVKDDFKLVRCSECGREGYVTEETFEADDDLVPVFLALTNRDGDNASIIEEAANDDALFSIFGRRDAPSLRKTLARNVLGELPLYLLLSGSTVLMDHFDRLDEEKRGSRDDLLTSQASSFLAVVAVRTAYDMLVDEDDRSYVHKHGLKILAGILVETYVSRGDGE